MSEETPDYQVDTVLEPIEQGTIEFYGKPLTLVRLPDGAPAVAFRDLCQNMGLDRTSQYQRVQRNKALARGYHTARIETPGGPQVAGVLTLRVTPGWLFGIEAKRAAPEVRADIERYQDEAMEVLYQWASTPHVSAPATLVPDKPIEQPVMPEQGASRELWRAYYLQMAEFLDWQTSMETWRGHTDQRLDNLEAVIPTILKRLPDPTITAAHQNMVKYYISQWSKASGKPYGTLYSSLYTAFQVPTYSALREDEWNKIEAWLKKQLEGARGRGDDKPEQGQLL